MHRLAFALVAASLSATAQVQTTWVHAPGGVAVARDAADAVFTARWDYNPAGDITVAKHHANGALLWEARHDNTDATRHEMATWVASDSAGNVLVSGTIRSGFSNPVNAASLLMKFSPAGALLWRRVFGSDFDGSSTVRVLVDGQDRAYAVGLGVGPSGLVGTVRQFNADGSPGWTWFDGAGIGAPMHAKRTPDGATLVIGRWVVGSGNGYAKVDGAGQTVWAFATPSLTAGDAAGDGAGRTYVVHRDAAGSGTSLKKIAPDGALLWTRVHPMSAFRVEVLPDGGAMLSGFPSVGQGGAAFARYDADGQLLWSNPAADGVGLLLHAQMLVDAAGNAYLAGSNLVSMGVTRVNADGSPGWTALVPFGSSTGIALGSQQQVYLTGGQTARLDVNAPPPVVDLAVALAGAPDPATLRRPLVYGATVRNLGTVDAHGVQFALPLAATLGWRDSRASQGQCSGSTTVRCDLGSLAPGAAATVEVTVVPRRRGQVSVTASVASTEADGQPADNTSTVTTTVLPRR